MDGILRLSLAPANASAALQPEAENILRRIMEKLDYAGVMAVEFFEEDGRLLVNEIAPRVHNSGHWTEAACHVSQFEQHMRAVASPTSFTRPTAKIAAARTESFGSRRSRFGGGQVRVETSCQGASPVSERTTRSTPSSLMWSSAWRNTQKKAPL